VYGGRNLCRHCVIDNAVLRQLEWAAAFAPLHNPPALSVIRFVQEQFPQLPQVACLDTAFHAAMPEIACTLPIPRELRSDGIRRYGFHGADPERWRDHGNALRRPRLGVLVYLMRDKNFEAEPPHSAGAREAVNGQTAMSDRINPSGAATLGIAARLRYRGAAKRTMR
jgi:Acetokinase family